MAWGDNVNTEDEAERIAAVREYFHEHIPNASIRNSYDVGRLAQSTSRVKPCNTTSTDREKILRVRESESGLRAIVAWCPVEKREMIALCRAIAHPIGLRPISGNL